MPVLTEISGDGDEGFSRAEDAEFHAILRGGILGSALLRLSGQFAEKVLLLQQFPTFYAPLSETVMLDIQHN